MNFLIIPDSFKNCLSATDVGHNIARGIKQIFTDAKTTIIPIADGGEGTVQAIVSALNGKVIEAAAHDPLMRPIKSFIGVSGDGKTAIIEMAAASGIELITKSERNPLITTTYGTGELIKKALDLNCNEIIIGIGGSATNDGGTGMAAALGVLFLDKNNQPIPLGGGGISNLHRIDPHNIDPRLAHTSIKVACDVKNPLFGTTGASTVYGAQKGANNEQIQLLDKNLEHLANCLLNLGIDVTNLAGGGAAGGLGAGLFAFANGKLERGFTIIAHLLNLEENIAQADIVITAEGAIDEQTLFGKTPAGVASIAKRYKKPVFVFAGNALDDFTGINEIGITSIVPITRKPTGLDEAIKNAPKWLYLSAIELCASIKTGLEFKK